MADNDKPDGKLVLKNVRFSYAQNLFKPRAADEKSPPKFSVSLILPPDHPQIADIKRIVKQVLAHKFPTGKVPAGLHNPLRDGNERINDEAYAGNLFVNAAASVDYPPKVIDYQKQVVKDLSFWTSGDYGNASVNFYWFDKVNRGVACGLNGVQFVKKGEPLSGRGNVLNDFEVEEMVDDGDSAFD